MREVQEHFIENSNNMNAIINVNESNETINEFERLSLFEAKKYNVDYVYFQRKNIETNPKVSSYILAYIYDNTNNKINAKQIVNIHKMLWSSQSVLLYMVIDKQQIKIYNPRKPVKFNQEKKNLNAHLIETISITAEIYSQFINNQITLKFLQSKFYEENLKDEYLEKFSPHHILLEFLIEIRDQFIKDNNFPLSTLLLNKLLVMFILIKYLEEKEDDIGRTIIDIDDYIWKKHNAKSFTKILTQGKILEFLSDLSYKFNGHVFYLTKNEKLEISKLSKLHLEKLSGYFEGIYNPKENMDALLELYSFNNLPIELISGIYEAFLPKKNSSIVYTPPYLVNLMVDEAMPLENYKAFKNNRFKVFDPACGSGIYLVSAYKRLIEWKILNQYNKNGVLKMPNIKDLKNILKKNIFGLDIKKGAQEIAIYSLSLALCRFLSPITIWNELEFDDLGEENILHQNYFEYYKDYKSKSRFDLIIGNPPFDEITKQKYSKIIKDCDLVLKSEIPGPELAFLFLETSIDLLKQNAPLSFVLPSKIIYNQSKIAKEFQSKFFNDNYVIRINDFTLLRNVVFKGSTVSVCNINLIKKEVLIDHELEHIIYQRYNIHENRIKFEVDYYDIHKVKNKIACENILIWKSNLMGGGRLFHFVKQLTKERKFEEYLTHKKIHDKWVFGEGYDLIPKKEKEKGIEYISNKFPKATHITNYEYVRNYDFTISGIKKTQSEDSEYFHTTGTRKSIKEIFYAPHVLIRKIPSLPVHFLDYDLRFKNGIIGIHAPNTKENIEELKTIEERFKKYRELYKFFIYVTSNRTLTSRGGFYSAQKSDIMNLPYPKDENTLKLNKSESILVNDVLNYYSKLDKKSTKNPLNENAKSDPDLIENGKKF